MEPLASYGKQSWLTWFLRGILLFGMVVLVGRVFELQIIKGDYFRQLSEGNRIRRVPIIAPRGRIIARGGETLVGNSEIKRKVVFDPIVGYEKVDVQAQENGSDILTEWLRDYKLGSGFAHASGYLGETNEKEVGKVKPDCLDKGPRKLGSFVGRTGLEEQYECVLSGFDGEELVEVDSIGLRVRTLGRLDPVPGADIKTTINFGLQSKVAEVMKGYRGAVVVSDLRGEILAIFSSPSFDPNILIDGDRDQISAILEDNDKPLFNRAIGGTYPPGSVYKPIVAIAGLEDKVIDKDYKYNDPGIITIESRYGTFSYSNWYFTQYGSKEGEIGIVRAITRSTDTFFYKLGELIGIDSLTDWSRKFGLDEISGIDIPGEATGLVPSPEWKEKVKGERWFLGNTYHMAIGQGDLLLTPLSLNTAISAIASGNQLCEPYLYRGSKCSNLTIEQNNIDIVKEGMIGACSTGGTGFTFFDFAEKTGKSVACKTGTAETGDGETTHAWFVAFAPVDFPEIVATVFIENGGEGSYVAGPIAREIFDYWFNDRNKEL